MQTDQHLRSVSVIIPTYNRAALIGRTIESVLGQTYPHVEIIVVDDGSTDDTRKVLAQYGERIHYIYEQNAGPSTARNRGARASRADYIGFLDSDDLMLPNKLERQVAYLDAHPDMDIVLCGWRRTRRDGSTRACLSVPTDRILESILLSGVHGFLATAVPLMRRTSFDRTPGFDESLPSREDQDFWMQAALAGCKYGCVRGVLCIFTDTEGSYGKNMASTERALPMSLQKVFGRPDLPERVAALKDDAYGRLYLELGEHHLAHSDSEDDPELDIAQRYLTQALALLPRRTAWTQEHLDPIAYQALAFSDGVEPDACLARLITRLFATSPRPAWLEARLRGCLYAMEASAAYRGGQYALTAHDALEAIHYWPGLLRNRGVPAVLVKSAVDRVIHRHA